jgi:hypothetical protein
MPQYDCRYDERCEAEEAATEIEEGLMLNRLRKLLGKAAEGHNLHAPFHVTTHHGHTVQTFQSLETAIEAAASLGPDHYVIDRHGLQIWNPQRKLLRNEE